MKGKSYLLRACRYDIIGQWSCFSQLWLNIYTIIWTAYSNGYGRRDDDWRGDPMDVLLNPCHQYMYINTPDYCGVTTPSLYVKSVVIWFVRLTRKETWCSIMVMQHCWPTCQLYPTSPNIWQYPTAPHQLTLSDGCRVTRRTGIEIELESKPKPAAFSSAFRQDGGGRVLSIKRIDTL